MKAPTSIAGLGVAEIGPVMILGTQDRQWAASDFRHPYQRQTYSDRHLRSEHVACKH